jgi:hypothetical protein
VSARHVPAEVQRDADLQVELHALVRTRARRAFAELERQAKAAGLRPPEAWRTVIPTAEPLAWANGGGS